MLKQNNLYNTDCVVVFVFERNDYLSFVLGEGVGALCAPLSQTDHEDARISCYLKRNEYTCKSHGVIKNGGGVIKMNA